jgi:hypothetical protein
MVEPAAGQEPLQVAGAASAASQGYGAASSCPFTTASRSVLTA